MKLTVLLKVETPETFNSLENNVVPVTVVIPENVEIPEIFKLPERSKSNSVDLNLREPPVRPVLDLKVICPLLETVEGCNLNVSLVESIIGPLRTIPLLLILVEPPRVL